MNKYLPKHQLCAAVAMFPLFLCGLNEARADDIDSIATWMCKNLNAKFNPVATIQQFPLEKMPEPIVKRKVSEKMTSFDLSAKGDRYSVEYHYQYSNENVSEHYGFNLKVYDQGADSSIDREKVAKRWLRRFGKVQPGVIGYSVGSSKKMLYGGESVANFGAWTSGWPTYLADWFNAKDINDFHDLCKGAGLANE
ncbi:hypothetical protein [Novosphingobium sp.]|uniref:hypothetical protein n=1 Tax=Novosphingobium sp. TaxID=1874826 RepID=UPI0033425396